MIALRIYAGVLSLFLIGIGFRLWDDGEQSRGPAAVALIVGALGAWLAVFGRIIP